MENYKVEFKGGEFNKLAQIANKDFLHWEAKKSGQKQCFNTFNSCMVGVLAEATVAKYAKDVYGKTQGFSIRKWGMSERTQSKPFYSKPDIEVNLPDYTFNIEVKGITFGQQKGQILPYHISKYIKAGVNMVVFVEVLYDLNQETASCEIYCKESPRVIAKTWEMLPNKYNKTCHTNPKFI